MLPECTGLDYLLQKDLVISIVVGKHQYQQQAAVKKKEHGQHGD